MRLAGLKRRDRRAVMIENSIAGVGRDAIAGHDDSDKVQRVSRAYRDQTILRAFAPDRAQHPDRFRQSELFSRNACDEAAAANLTTRFQPVIKTQEHAPR